MVANTLTPARAKASTSDNSVEYISDSGTIYKWHIEGEEKYWTRQKQGSPERRINASFSSKSGLALTLEMLQKGLMTPQNLLSENDPWDKQGVLYFINENNRLSSTSMLTLNDANIKIED